MSGVWAGCPKCGMVPYVFVDQGKDEVAKKLIEAGADLNIVSQVICTVDDQIVTVGKLTLFGRL